MIAFWLLAGAAFAERDTKVDVRGDAENGKNLYVPCVACHGAQGEGNPALNSPALGGQDGAYLSRQLEQFRSGSRGSDPADTYGAQMRAMAATLSAETAVADVVAYISTFPAVSSAAGGAANRNGENQYNAACGACHGSRAEGNPRLNAPRLAGLTGDYLRRQYQNYASGLRGSDPADTYGRQMQMMSSMLASEQDLDDVINFILAQ
jgi:cytochrome c oxidase subunit 2